jgi:hypothetical protein
MPDVDAPEAVEILRPGKKKWVMVLLISVGFVAIGIAVIQSPTAAMEPFMAYGSVIFFGIGVVAAIVQLLPGSAFLRLSPEGFTIRHMWRNTVYRWSDIERFGVLEIRPSGHRQRMVGLNFSESFPNARRVRSMVRSLSGFDGALPDNYGWDCARLAAHLESWKARWADGIPATEPPGPPAAGAQAGR